MRKHNPPQNILIIRIDRMGDLIVSTPAILMLEQACPEARFTYLLSPCNQKILDNGKRDIWLYDKQMSLRDKTRLLSSIIRLKADCTICMSPKHFAYLATCMSYAHQRYAMIYANTSIKQWLISQCMTHSMAISRKQPNINFPTHHGDRIVELISPLIKNTPKPSFHITLEHRDIIQGTFIGIHLDQRWKHANWTTSELQNLFKSIEATTQKPIVITADVKHYPGLFDPNDIIGTSPQQIVKPSLGQWTVFDQAEYPLWANIIRQASKWITAEGGSVHIAASVKTPCIAWIDTALYGKASIRSHQTFQSICSEWLKPAYHHAIFHCGDLEKLKQNILTAIESGDMT